jgi:hypothetical protein
MKSRSSRNKIMSPSKLSHENAIFLANPPYVQCIYRFNEIYLDSAPLINNLEYPISWKINDNCDKIIRR